VAGDVGDGDRLMDGRFSKKVQTELGILAVPHQQRVVDHLGNQRSGVCPDRIADLSGLLECPRRGEKQLAVKWAGVMV
jgi:hypothetical protein